LRSLNYLDLILFSILAVIFVSFPNLDIAFSELFYSKQNAFEIGQQTWALFFYHIVTYISYVLLLGLPALIVISFFKIVPLIITKNRKRFIYLLLVLLMGPGLLVNTLFKNQWDRARPIEIEYFGGTKIHTPAFIISDQCNVNCSFVSGHASMGFFFIAFYWVTSTHRRRWMFFGIVLGSLISLARIAQGGHFLSDVIFSFFSVYFVAQAIAYFYKPLKK